MGRQRRIVRRRRRLAWIAGGGIAALALAASALLVRTPTPASPADVQRLIAQHRPDAAWQAAAEALPRAPNDAHLLAMLDTLYAGLCDSATGEPVPPRDPAPLRRLSIILRNAMLEGRDTPLAEQVLGEVALAAGYAELAATALQRAITLGVPEVRLDHALAIALLYDGHYPDVLRLTAAATDVTPHLRALLLIVRARAELALAQPEHARQSLMAALAIEPANVDALSRLGVMTLWQDRDRSATATLLGRATQAAAEASPTLRLIGEYDYATGDYAGSAQAYGTLTRLGLPDTFDPTPPSLGAARALIYAGDLDAAKAVMDASRLPDGDPSLRYYRALLAYRAGAFQQAAELAQPLGAAMAKYPPLDLLLGGAMLATGFPSTAVARLNNYVAAVPNDAAAQHLLTVAQRAEAHGGKASISARDLQAAFGFPMPAAVNSGPKGGS